MATQPGHPDISGLLAALDCVLCDLAPDLREPIEQAIGQLARFADAEAQRAATVLQLAELRQQTLAEQEIVLAALRREAQALREVARARQRVANSQSVVIRKLLGQMDGERNRAYLAACERSAS